MPGVRLQRREVLVGDGVHLVLLADEHVLFATLDAAFDALAVGHLLRAVLAILVHRFAHGIADPSLIGLRQESGSRKQRDCRDTSQGLSHTYLHFERRQSNRESASGYGLLASRRFWLLAARLAPWASGQTVRNSPASCERELPSIPQQHARQHERDRG